MAIFYFNRHLGKSCLLKYFEDFLAKLEAFFGQTFFEKLSMPPGSLKVILRPKTLDQRRTGHTGLPGLFPVGPRTKKVLCAFSI